MARTVPAFVMRLSHLSQPHWHEKVVAQVVFAFTMVKRDAIYHGDAEQHQENSL